MEPYGDAGDDYARARRADLAESQGAGNEDREG